MNINFDEGEKEDAIEKECKKTQPPPNNCQ